MQRAEIDSQSCGDCFHLRYNDSDKFGWKANKTGEGYCIKLDPGKTIIINAENSIRQSLETLGRTDEIAGMKKSNNSCFEYRGLVFSKEAIEVFLPDRSSRIQLPQE